MRTVSFKVDKTVQSQINGSFIFTETVGGVLSNSNIRVSGITLNTRIGSQNNVSLKISDMVASAFITFDNTALFNTPVAVPILASPAVVIVDDRKKFEHDFFVVGGSNMSAVITVTANTVDALQNDFDMSVYLVIEFEEV